MYFNYYKGQNGSAFTEKQFKCSAKYIKFNEIRNNFFLDALSKSDAHWQGKQELFLYGLNI